MDENNQIPPSSAPQPTDAPQAAATSTSTAPAATSSSSNTIDTSVKLDDLSDDDATKEFESVKYFDAHLADQLRRYNELCLNEGITPSLPCAPSAFSEEFVRIHNQSSPSMNAASTSAPISSPSVFNNLQPNLITAMQQANPLSAAAQPFHSPIASAPSAQLPINSAISNSTLRLHSSTTSANNANVSNVLFPPPIPSSAPLRSSTTTTANNTNVSNVFLPPQQLQQRVIGNQSMPIIDANAIAQQIQYLQGLLQQAIAQQAVVQQPVQQNLQQSIQVPQPQQAPFSVSAINLPTSSISQSSVFNQSQAPQMTVVQNKYNLPLPKFSKKNVEIYFLQLDLWFEHRGISNSDEEKYRTLATSIDSDVLLQVSGAAQHAAVGQRFDTLKRAIIANFADSETQRLKKLLAGIPLGDNKPSQLVNILRNTCPNATIEQQSLIRHVWLDQLPVSIRSIIVANRAKCAPNLTPSLDDEARLADAVFETIDPKASSVYEIASSSTASSATDATVDAIVAEVTKKFERIFSRRFNHRSRSRSRSRNRNTSNECDNRDGSNSPTLCYYHREFGTDARKCRSPCKFKKSTEDQKN